LFAVFCAICFSVTLHSCDPAIVSRLHRPGLENLNPLAQPAASSLDDIGFFENEHLVVEHHDCKSPD
jgi:hypothetical protein